ncbi:hypothetical protein HRR78_002519 [Exophiala dermatitidis]|nr:hypothetical protein HRR78_002519 [Exophiala dermatitidis]
MARISIPLDALTSRFNLSDRFNSVRSQSISSRFANIRPISEFLDLKRLSKPHDFGEVQSRVNYNLSYFSSNYAVVFVMLSIYSLLTNLWLLFDIILVAGGMWTIGKLGGGDLEIGTFRATTSQLYTGLACIAIPVAFISSPISTFLWLIGGRPRTPYDMPPWGRPPGGRPGRKNNRPWGVQRSWEYEDRVEELDTEDDTVPGVGLGQDYGQQRFVSDELRFTGIDLGGGGIRQRRSGDVYDDELTPSDDEDEYGTSSGLIRRPDVQVMYREKEEMLVERALERIARARALGKPNVKLSRAEIDALERLERNQHPPRPSAAPKAAPRGKKEAPIKRKPVEVRKKPVRNDKSASNSPKGKAVDSRGRGKSAVTNASIRDDAVASYALPPTDSDYGRRAPYVGYPVSGSRQAESSRQGSRQGSRQSSNPSLRQQQAPQMALYQQPYYAHRYSSTPDALYSARPGSNSSRASRPDPSEPDWEPRSRSSSSLVNVPLDQLPYQSSTARAPRFDPSDPRFASPQRRVASGPPDIRPNQAAQYRRPQDELFLPDEPPEVMRYLVSSGSEKEADDDDDDDDDSDYDEGVQIDVTETPRGDYTIRTRSAAASGSARRGGPAPKSTAGKGKKRR